MHEITIYFTEKEYCQLAAAANMLNMSINQFVHVSTNLFIKTLETVKDTHGEKKTSEN